MSDLLEPTGPEPYLQSYYIGFDPTGVKVIDAILEELCRAAKMYHSTEGWSDSEYDDEPSYQERIQAAANEAAGVIRAAVEHAYGQGFRDGQEDVAAVVREHGA